jgi:hypothetical protein
MRWAGRILTALKQAPGMLPPVLLSLVMLVAGFAMLKDWRGPAYTLTNELYVPSAMMALGQGFINPPLDEVPGLREFLHKQGGAATFTLQGAPETFSATELDTYQRYHRYLVFAMGLVWSVTGVSWEGAKVLSVGLHAAAGIAVYLLFRLVMGRWLSFAGALLFALSPVVLSFVYDIRDFSKVPFLLLAICLMYQLLTREFPFKGMLLRVAALGLVLGLGTGFRRDVMIALPPALLCILFAECRISGRLLARRAAALGLFAFSFVVAAFPVLSALNERGSMVHHDALMGMATMLDGDLAIRPASYEKVPEKNDFFITAITNAHARAANLGVSTEYDNFCAEPAEDAEDARTRFLKLLIFTYPADFVLRAMAAVLAICRGVAHIPFSWSWLWDTNLNYLGPLYAFTAAAIAMRLLGFRRAAAVVLLTLYFCAITCLQYEARHALHLCALPVACTLLVWREGLSWLQRWVVPGGKISSPPAHHTSWRFSWLFASAAVAAPICMWGVLLPWQIHQMRVLETALVAAPLELVNTKITREENWTWISPAVPLTSPLPDPERVAFFRPHYLMCEFESFGEGSPLAITFDASSQLADYSMVVSPTPAELSAGTPVRYYFVAPECAGGTLATNFRGIGIPPEYAGHFKGLYRVTSAGPFASNPNVTLIDGRMPRRFQTIDPLYTPPPQPEVPRMSTP